MENFDHFVFFVRSLEILVRDLEFLRNAEYYYVHNALRVVEIIVPSLLISDAIKNLKSSNHINE